MTAVRRITTAIGWIRHHKRRTLAIVSTPLLLGYVCLFFIVSCAGSPTDEWIELADGRALAYERFAGGDPEGGRLVLVHGAPANAVSWHRLLNQHRGRLPFREIVIIDRLGYGNSAADGQELTLAGHAASLLPFLEPMSSRAPILVGHSYGGPVVLRAAAEYTERVGGIVLVAGATDAEMNDAIWFRKLINGISLVVPEPWAIANRELLALTAENDAMQPLLDQVICPITVVHGEWDPVCPHDGTIAHLQSTCVNAAEVRVVSLPKTGHNIHLSDPEVIAEAVSAMVADVAGSEE
jgi:pimeloyl-ACP methyl ester carboxylesterase